MELIGACLQSAQSQQEILESASTDTRTQLGGKSQSNSRVYCSCMIYRIWIVRKKLIILGAAWVAMQVLGMESPCAVSAGLKMLFNDYFE